VKMSEADVIVRPAQSEQQQIQNTKAAAATAEGGSDAAAAAAAAVNAAVAFGSPADAAGMLGNEGQQQQQQQQAPVGRMSHGVMGQALGRLTLPEHHDDIWAGDMSDSCSQVGQVQLLCLLARFSYLLLLALQ
jgi:hypothetical protein